MDVRILSGYVLLAASAAACSVTGIPKPAELVRNADAIVVAKAAAYSDDSRDTDPNLSIAPIRFQVIERIRGDAPSEITLRGRLTDQDDYNDGKAPYEFVRPGGRSGSCYAWDYRAGAEFLLFLKKVGGALTVNWAALAPVNEQVHPEDDRWVQWVRDEARKIRRSR